ncbi:LPXTG cell wall anchor domain-containing protein [Cellulomonas sp. HZM]|uniref:LPXTG cell wall anchor domain-containing protein n=1 Tax=Cellulomonas sp. HZM TaxID=1454010 RepID=UPI00049325A5|nr:LPXTG cell wall anchor domain-containing protein [Cellulomonas sp. HZM]
MTRGPAGRGAARRGLVGRARRGPALTAVLAGLVVLLPAALGPAVLPAAAAATADQLLLSTDGVTWGTTIPGRLFAGVDVAVPGDTLAGTLWVRNTSSDPARVDLAAAHGLGSGADSLLGALELTVDGHPVAGGTRWHGPGVAAGATVRLDLAVTFDADAALGARSQVTHVLDAVLLVQTADGAGATPTADPPTPTPDPPTPSPSGPTSGPPSTPAPSPTASGGAAPGDGLAHTGSDAADLVWPALGAVVVGALLLLARRRRADDEP